jgi:CubicO group peptidase (beta-lactamase class C family)
MSLNRRVPLAALILSAFVTSLAAQDSNEALEHAAAMAAHHLCAGIWVVGRDYRRSADQVLQQDITRFPDFAWRSDFRFEIDDATHRATVTGPDIPAQTAHYNGDQGCTILPEGAENVFFDPVDVRSSLPDPSTQSWPTGDLGAYEPVPDGVDQEELTTALDWAMTQDSQNTRALVVTYRGKIIGERYAPGFTKDTPQISWSMGKSITAALIGVLVQQGHLHIDDPAPVAEWRDPDDPRSQILIKHLLRMSSGLDFQNWGLNRPNSWSVENEHFRIYFDAINVFEHAVNQPLEIAPNKQSRYRNSDPLTLGRIVRETVEGSGGDYLTFPQQALFDEIGTRNFVLETDPYGNFIMTGYDFGSAWDWTRFGLLHLWNGEWIGERVLPDWWSEFVSTPAPGDRRRGYGGLFWLNRGGSMDQVPEDAYWAAGYMGQRTMIIPSYDMVIVRLGPSPSGFGSYFNEVVGRVLEAIGSRR